MNESCASSAFHSHVFLGEGHEKSERKTWVVIWLCGIMMVAEIVGGLLFGSSALVADGLHMSTHAGALLLAALAYTYARKHADNPSFSFGTSKFGDLARFTSAIILTMISLLIGYESISRIFEPVLIHFAEAIPVAILGLAVNIASAWLLSQSLSHLNIDMIQSRVNACKFGLGQRRRAFRLSAATTDFFALSALAPL